MFWTLILIVAGILALSFLFLMLPCCFGQERAMAGEPRENSSRGRSRCAVIRRWIGRRLAPASGFLCVFPIAGWGLIVASVLTGALITVAALYNAAGLEAVFGAVRSTVGSVWDRSIATPSGVVFLFGGLVGVAELVSRYRDDPFRAMTSRPALVYILVNAMAGVAALELVDRFRVFEETTDERQREAYEVLLAGFGAMVFFRSAIFTVRVGGSDVAIGPGGMLQSILHMADRATDRRMALGRAPAVKRLMKHISFVRAKQALPVLCAALMQNLPSEEQAAMGRTVRDLEASKMDDDHKAMNMALALMNVVGEPVLEQAVKALASGISADTRSMAVQIDSIDKALGDTSFASAQLLLPVLCAQLHDRPTGEEADQLRKLATSIDALGVSDHFKMRCFAYGALRIVGLPTLEKALDILNAGSVGPPPPWDDEDYAVRLRRLNFDKDGERFVETCLTRAGLAGDSATRDKVEGILGGITTEKPDDPMIVLFRELIRLLDRDPVVVALYSMDG